MTVTMQLLMLFRVDKQLRGLRSRLEGAERFLEQQKGLLRDIDEKKKSTGTQLKTLRASIANDEGEAARLEEKVTLVREQMNSLKTAKEYNAALTELNTFKEKKTKHEETALESMSKVDSLDAQFAELKKQHDERSKIVAGAEADRVAKAAEIKDRLDELTDQRKALADSIPPGDVKTLDSLIKLRGDDAMAPVEILDRRNHEYSCSACMMALPVETVSSMLSGRLTRCVSCHSIIYTEEELLAAAKPPAKPKAAKPKSPPKQVAKTPG
jgi:uncharacterized protein